MLKDAIDLGESTKFNIEDEHYKTFCNQEEKGEARSERVVFTTDWQRFLWAFILGIHVETRTPLRNKTKTPPFGTEVFKNKSRILKLMIGLTLQEMYKDNPHQLKVDYEETSQNGENLGKRIRIAIEEYANTGFAIMVQRSRERPGYIESLEDVVSDILSEKGWS